MAEKLSLNLDLRPQELTPEDYLAIAESIQWKLNPLEK